MLTALALLAAIAISDAWLVWDCQRLRKQGVIITASIGPFTITRTEQWLLACLVFWIIAFPAYLIARSGPIS